MSRTANSSTDCLDNFQHFRSRIFNNCFWLIDVRFLLFASYTANICNKQYVFPILLGIVFTAPTRAYNSYHSTYMLFTLLSNQEIKSRFFSNWINYLYASLSKPTSSTGCGDRCDVQKRGDWQVLGGKSGGVAQHSIKGTSRLDFLTVHTNWWRHGREGATVLSTLQQHDITFVGFVTLQFYAFRSCIFCHNSVKKVQQLEQGFVSSSPVCHEG